MRTTTKTLAMICVMLAWTSAPTRAESTPSTLLGTWVGSASNTHITPSDTPIPLTLTISADGSVAGNLGTAVVKNGGIKKNRGTLGKFFNMKSDYLIYADLEGSLVADKDIRYEGVFINLNIEDDKIVAAGFTTTHSRHGTPITKQGLVRGKITLEKKVASEETKE